MTSSSVVIKQFLATLFLCMVVVTSGTPTPWALADAQQGDRDAAQPPRSQEFLADLAQDAPPPPRAEETEEYDELQEESRQRGLRLHEPNERDLTLLYPRGWRRPLWGY